MARYIDADALIERLKFKRDETDISGKKYSGLECAIAQVQKQPTADVAPKSEVERLEHILDCYALQYGTVTDQQKVIEKAKSEVAREIFEEIEKLRVIGIHGFKTYLKKDIDELKKKYTEEQNNEN